MTNKEYNGWHNYETWVVNLWMDNDEGSQSYWQEQAEECVKVDGREDAVTSLSDLIKDNHEEQWSEINQDRASVFSDLMGAALSEVNWREIAQHLVDEVAVEVEA